MAKTLGAVARNEIAHDRIGLHIDVGRSLSSVINEMSKEV